MEKAFWLNKWLSNEIGFHNPEAHGLLVKYFGQLKLTPGSRVFVPLCGKTLDIGWLLKQGFSVCGAELSEDAVIQLFEELAVEPEIVEVGPLRRYGNECIDIYVGDIFHLSREDLGPVDAIYDRAALVALPEAMRHQYTQHLIHLTDTAAQLLITFDYDQQRMPGPPFCVSDQEVAQHYAADYQLVLVDSVEVPGGLKGKCPAQEKVWLLKGK
ncbi:thiopurine S-methyltransferase [Microbulbifer hydrolyticus]|uniref:Thiopurine S-methyltransferase n=1 Tax=Microbulbifer hydrolyticus TaxID=48074 RepID=A0A6P1TEM2_9GAMM|nr:thiopurine S-methyltransferase [Microbulbifer hydrolyticus]MBB5210290.1 thiopurine S-methyltransferase [Microbulbifer hydrolyticus]QHQ39212.1 thiopurine S-methyltransferase [Microbulbifer hydrolyticus]